MITILDFNFETWLGIVGLAFGLVSLAFSYYWYRRSIQKAIPSYGVHPLRAQIITETNIKRTGLQVLYNGSVIDSTVTATRVYFWNNGREPMRRVDVLAPFKIELPSTSQILSWGFVKSPRDVCGLKLIPEGEPEEVDDGKFVSKVYRLALEFEVIEETDGVSIQIIHTGDETTAVVVTGILVGANKPRRYNVVYPERFGILLIISMTLVVGVNVAGLVAAFREGRIITLSTVLWTLIILFVVGGGIWSFSNNRKLRIRKLLQD